MDREEAEERVVSLLALCAFREGCRNLNEQAYKAALQETSDKLLDALEMPREKTWERVVQVLRQKLIRAVPDGP